MQQENENPKLDKLTLKSWISVYKISIACFLLIVFVFGLIPYFRPEGHLLQSWSSGAISNNHKMLENNCQACHQAAFSAVKDQACDACHKLSFHFDKFADILDQKHPQHIQQDSCTTCHFEHRGKQGNINSNSQICSQCHADLKKIDPQTETNSFKTFSSHSEFRVSLIDQNGKAQKVSLDSSQDKLDRNPLKLNHNLHLKAGLRGANGPVNMQCTDCHQYKSDLKSFKPINFENHCQSCHSLGFDTNHPDLQVPHAKPDVVYDFIFAEYAKQLLVDSNTEQSQSSERIKPGSDLKRSDTQSNKAFVKSEVEKLARSAEQELFTRTACQLCHITNEKNILADKSKFEVVKPQAQIAWMPAAIFSHAPHQEISCSSCHHAVKDSKETSDVLMPKIKDCKNCHTQSSCKIGQVKSDCIMCHSYHEAEVLPLKKTREIAEIIQSLR